MKRLFVALVLLIAVGVATAAALMQQVLNEPVGIETQLTVKPGATLRTVLDDMAQQGIVARPNWIYAHARLTKHTTVRAGVYRVRAVQSPREVLLMIERGEVQTESFTIPEGLNRWQVRDILAAQGWIDGATFDRLCDDATFLSEHRIPGPSCEGYFFPETYTFARGVDAQTIFAKAFTTYRQNFLAATAPGRGPLNLSERELVTLASIVEKETGAKEERPLIACVFYNRLTAEPAWRLETDPTVIYAATLLDPKFNGNITHYHLREMRHPYNTYLTTGLPPGPIASAGRAAFDAVAKPAQCRDFFFVSRNNGSHEFCPDLRCHERAVRRWQLRR